MFRITHAVVLLACLPCIVFSWKYSPDRDFRVVYLDGNMTIAGSDVLSTDTVLTVNCKGQLSWFATLEEDIPESAVEYQLTGKQQQAGVWKGALKQTRPLCNALRSPDRWINLLGFTASTPELGPCCPLKKGMYVLNMFDIDPRSFPKDAKLGQWLLEYKWTFNKKAFATVVLLIDIQSLY